MNKKHYKQLSKTLSYALRHAPQKFGIVLDEEGWTDLETLLAVLRQRRRDWANLQSADVLDMMAETLAKQNKQRFEVQEGNIRALYGHSTKQKIAKASVEPPAILYHGTARKTVPLIETSGLKVMGRQYVHLSADVETAKMVGQRRDFKAIILQVKALEAYQNGIAFYTEPNGIWLSEPIPPSFIIFP